VGNLVWYQYFEDELREVSSIDFGQVLLMPEGMDWTKHTFYSFTGNVGPDAGLYHARLMLKWTGGNLITDCKYVLVKSNDYTGSSDADTDLSEIQDWAFNGEYGLNKYPTPCQLYNPCYLIVDEEIPPTHPAGYYIQSWNGDVEEGGGEWAECPNLDSGANGKCLPCVNGDGEVVNLNQTDEWVWYDYTRAKMYTYTGGLIISQGEDTPNEDSWKQFNNTSTPAFTVASSPVTISTEVPQYIYLRMCIPWGCFCGGKRTVGFGLDYIYTE
jgi:hypothetical protein